MNILKTIEKNNELNNKDLTLDKKEDSKYNLEDLNKRFSTKSSIIRFLDSEKLTRSQIAKILDIRYQHVRNVLITPIKNQK